MLKKTIALLLLMSMLLTTYAYALSGLDGHWAGLYASALYDKGIFKGFRVGRKGGQVFHDFTQEAIADSLATFLRPELGEIVKQAAR